MSARKLALQVASEVERARTLFPNIHNMHEGLGVIEEEWEEFKKEFLLLTFARNEDSCPKCVEIIRKKAKEELLQVAAMCLRTILDCEL